MSKRPTVTFLTDELRDRVISEAREILFKTGIAILDDQLLDLLSDHGASVDKNTQKACIPPDLIDKTLKTVPSDFSLFDLQGRCTHHFNGRPDAQESYFTPASAALNILDDSTGAAREPKTADYIRYVKVVDGLKYIASQSTAFIPSDIDHRAADSYRLYLSLLYSEKPVVTGTFSEDGFHVMMEMQIAARSTEKNLKEKPLTVFSCCPTTPLKWAGRSCRDIVNCGKYGIPIELISMPLTGFTGPITLVGSLVEHTAENLCGIVLCQLSQPGAPLLYGGAPASFDMRYGTTALGAIETMMMDCAYNEIGKSMGIPTQAYIALSDSKTLDAQAGIETSMGAVMAVLSGINNISGPGMLEFVNCFSLEKLVVDNQICGMVQRMARGIEPKEDFPALPLFRELVTQQNLLSSAHTRRYMKEEHFLPGKTIDRTTRTRWKNDGQSSIKSRAQAEIEQLLKDYQPPSIDDYTRKTLTALMEKTVKQYGMDKLPPLL